MTFTFKKIRNFILPSRPDPSRSRRIAEVRLIIGCLLAFSVFVIIGVRIVDLADTKVVNPLPSKGLGIRAERGRILDRKGLMLAGNLPITLLHADPSEIMDVNQAASKLAPLLKHHDKESLRALLIKDTRYVELDRQLTPKRHAQILQLGIPGVYFAEDSVRVYPRDHNAAHILGFVDTDNKGIAGVEKSMNNKLESGEDVTLSIDIGLQAIIRHEIQKQIDSFQAIGGAGILLDIETGEMLTMVSLPDFNPNRFSSVKDQTRFNRATKGLYEMGSTFKVLNTAIALESGAAKANQRFEVSEPLRRSRYTITDYHPHKKPLNVPEILVYSSNIGSALIAEAIGAGTQQAFMEKLGLFDRLKLEIPETSKPLAPKHWHRTTTVTVSYGHGISISPAHLASAVAAASGNGYWIQPTLLRRWTNDNPLKLKVFSEQTAKAVRSMMRLVVSHNDGTGNKAEAHGYMVGGKTGTAEKIQVGGYNEKANLAIFVATFPVHDPRFVIVVLVDEPKGQKHSHGYTTAGWVAAPAIRRIVEQIAPMLGIHPVDEKLPSIRQKLMLDFKIGNEEATLASY